MTVTADYVLQGVDPAKIAAAPFDVQVVETENDSGVPFTKAQVSLMKSGGSQVLGYFNLGEAENYRDYFSALSKSIVGPEDPDWPGNFNVAYWTPEWKSVAQKAIDQMISAGYNGIYFDVVDEFYSSWAKSHDPNAEQDMVNLVVSLKQYAVSKDPNFKVWVNGAEELLDHANYVSAIDGMFKEEVYYTDSGKKQSVSEAKHTVENLQKAVDAGKPVVVIEYVSGATKIADVHALAAHDGLGSYIGHLDLNGIDYDGVLPGQTVHPIGGSTGGTTGGAGGSTGGSTGGTGGSTGGATGGTGGSTGGTGGTSDGSNSGHSQGPITANYVLQGVDPAKVAKAPFDVQVVETENDSGVPFTASQVSLMKSGGSQVLGYFNLGEAENYRDYFSTLSKSIVGPEDRNWPGNFHVAYWTPEWKAVAQKAIDQMISAGYDGIYFDVVDEFYSSWAKKHDPHAEQDMVDLVVSLKQYAVSKDPDFKVWVNGAEELLDHTNYLNAIDGMFKEEVYYTDSGKKQPLAETQYTLENLQKAVDAGKPVVAIEYVSGASKIADVHTKASHDGIGSYVAHLDLDGIDYDGVLPGQTVHSLGTTTSSASTSLKMATSTTTTAPTTQATAAAVAQPTTSSNAATDGSTKTGGVTETQSAPQGDWWHKFDKAAAANSTAGTTTQVATDWIADQTQDLHHHFSHSW
ncbi:MULTISPECIES: endo alpha-1,4 polygalactosaminidase [unclassified Bradyrhizobium]|uniref:endo alpha-1,4 polygalactosaminidase n=1 Tax=unclassified Bradyrhizobium TaxID=2631580 RepID=UPI00247AC63B|nr:MULTISPECIES: endo alpha-1,4 polygalactosaminidase [unclassified Bradyrhizobium]WGR73415.1 endo alpha-1,4 polygalactosaminidase [Bradyrhizobium sp. ISRA426]WGR78252.1 endo alpha-1,4 polygalactosaminidase [Bradyrhizobium sp. ISRA430]WGR88653.1 endo alpha-1,4 polygalactosaminidase [Bradyrhizobium sp. ISRA432]